MTRTFTRTDDLAKHRVEMKRKLRLVGYPVDNDDTTERFEELVESLVSDEDRVFMDRGDDNYGTW